MSLLTGLIGAWWNGFSDPSNSVSGTPTTLSNSPSWVAGPGNAPALAFSGTSTSNYADTGVNPQNSPGSIVWWQNPTGTWNDSTFRETWGANSGSSVTAQVFSDNNWYVGWAGAVGDQRVIIPASSTNYIQNKWNMYATTWGAGGAKFYLNDGQLLGSVSGAVTTAAIPTTMLIGKYTGSSRGFPGSISLFLFYTRDISAPEIAQLYNGGQGLSYPFNVRRMGRPLFNRGIIVP